MSRRGEGQFVAAEIGLREDPKVLGLARRLGISRNEAVGVVVAWRSFVLLKGTFEGIVRGYTREEIAGYLEVRRSAAFVVDALKGAGMLVSRRGGAFAYPFWLETATGEYAQQKAATRKRQADWRERQRKEEEEATSGRRDSDVAATSNGRLGDVTIGDQLTNHRDVSPPGAPQGGAPNGASRLEWFEENYPKGLVEREKCAAILAGLSPDQWEHLQYAVRHKSRSIWWRERGRAPVPERWLEHSEWKREKRPKRKAAPDPEAQRRRAEIEAEEQAKYERSRRLLVLRAAIKDRLKAEGVPRDEWEKRIEDELTNELAKELPS